MMESGERENTQEMETHECTRRTKDIAGTYMTSCYHLTGSRRRIEHRTETDRSSSRHFPSKEEHSANPAESERQVSHYCSQSEPIPIDAAVNRLPRTSQSAHLHSTLSSSSHRLVLHPSSLQFSDHHFPNCDDPITDDRSILSTV